MTPVLVPRDIAGGIILVVEVIGAVVVAKHAIGVIHELPRRREVNLRAILAGIVSNDDGARRNTRTNVHITG